MVMKPEPIFAAVEDLTRNQRSQSESKIESADVACWAIGLINRWRQQLSQEPHLIIVCGHYEGVDHRVIEHLVDLEISIGDYVLTNGAIAAVVLVDAIVRLLPGALGHEQSAADDSFSHGSTRSSAVHAARQNFAVGKSRRFCFPEIMPRSRSGAKNRRSSARAKIGRICCANKSRATACYPERSEGSTYEVGPFSYLACHKLRLEVPRRLRTRDDSGVVIDAFYPARRTR